jgi:hypothetical protein
MFLKGHLARHMDLADLKQLGHRLPDLWHAYKADTADPSLDRFDEMVARLDEFESIRYPDRVLRQGIQSTISFTPPPADGDARRPEPRFLVIVGTLDELVTTLFRNASVNPPYFTNGLPPPAVEYLTKENATPLARSSEGA